MESNHCQIVEKSLSGDREIDEQTFVSLAILTDRLERLNKLGEGFAAVTFSSAAGKLAARESTLAIS